MSLLDEEKNKLQDCLKTANNFVILTTGRAGSDFLQSCYDNHYEVATTSEKTLNLSSFIEENKCLLPESSDVFAALAVKELFFSFAPFLNIVEDWRITKNDNYRKADVRKFLDCAHILKLAKEEATLFFNNEDPFEISQKILTRPDVIITAGANPISWFINGVKGTTKVINSSRVIDPLQVYTWA